MSTTKGNSDRTISNTPSPYDGPTQSKPTDAKANTNTPENPTPHTVAASHTLAASQTSTPPFSALFREHKILGVYSATYPDFLLSTFANDPSPLCYVTIKRYGQKGVPDITLHYNASPGSTIIGSAQIRFLSTDGHSNIVVGNHSDLQLKLQSLYERDQPYRPLPPSATSVTETFNEDGSFTVTTFDKAIPATSQRECFKWRNSGGPEVKSLNGRKRGLKLVRLSTGEIVAAFSAVSSSTPKTIAKMQWISNEDFGGGVDAMVVMTLLAVIQKWTWLHETTRDGYYVGSR